MTTKARVTEMHYSPDQIAHLIQVHKRTVLRAIETGAIAGAVKPFPNVIRVPASCVNDWLDRARIRNHGK